MKWVLPYPLNHIERKTKQQFIIDRLKWDIQGLAPGTAEANAPDPTSPSMVAPASLHQLTSV